MTCRPRRRKKCTCVEQKTFLQVNRASLLSDSFALAEAGLRDYSLVLNLMQYLTEETDFAPLWVAFDILDELGVGADVAELDEFLMQLLEVK